MRRITKFLLLGLVLICLGCEGQPSTNSIRGIITDVSVCQENTHYTTVILEFEDGRVQKLRSSFSTPILFQKNKINIISFDNIGTIQCVEIE